jgi:zinc protease
LKVRAGYDGTSIGMDFLSRNAAASFNILGELLADAAFKPEELERLRDRRLTSLLQRKEKPAAVASLSLYRLIYGVNHPYGNDPDGTEQTVRSITRDDVLKFYRGHYQPSDATMIVVGGVDERNFDSLIAGITARWNGQSAAERREVQPEAYRRRLLVVDRPNAPQTEIRVGCPGIQRTSPEFFPSVVLNRILGGQFSSRLNANLREKRGFTYGAWTSFSYGKIPGPFAAGSAVQTDVTGEAVREMLGEIDSIRLSGITESELAFTRAGIEGGFALMFESPAQVISILQNLVLYDLPEDHYDTYLDNIRKVTREDVLRTASKLLDPAEMSVVAVGDAKTILPQLEAIGLRDVEVATTDQLEL